jgi:hypothetical protein
MLVTILITIYCTLMYVVGYRFFDMRIGNPRFSRFLLWALSPVSVPFTVLHYLATR